MAARHKDQTPFTCWLCRCADQIRIRNTPITTKKPTVSDMKNLLVCSDFAESTRFFVLVQVSVTKFKMMNVMHPRRRSSEKVMAA